MPASNRIQNSFQPTKQLHKVHYINKYTLNFQISKYNEFKNMSLRVTSYYLLSFSEFQTKLGPLIFTFGIFLLLLIPFSNRNPHYFFLSDTSAVSFLYLKLRLAAFKIFHKLVVTFNIKFKTQVNCGYLL